MDTRDLTGIQRDWLEHVETCAAGGGSMKAYAKEHGLDLQSFYMWKGRLKKLGFVAVSSRRGLDPTASIVPVKISPTSGILAARTRIELASGIVIETPHNIDADVLCDLLRHAMTLPT